MQKIKIKFEFKKDGKRWFSLKEPLKVEFEDFKGVIPTTFLTDLASVPKGLHWAFKPDGKYTRASIIHDYICSLRNVPYMKKHKYFLIAMKEDKVNWFTRNLFYLSVVCFYWLHKRV